MDLHHVADATAAWVETWLHGNAHPRVVMDALQRLGRQHAQQPQALAIVERGLRVIATNPFGSIQDAFSV